MRCDRPRRRSTAAAQQGTRSSVNRSRSRSKSSCQPSIACSRRETPPSSSSGSSDSPRPRPGEQLAGVDRAASSSSAEIGGGDARCSRANSSAHERRPSSLEVDHRVGQRCSRANAAQRRRAPRLLAATRHLSSVLVRRVSPGRRGVRDQENVRRTRQRARERLCEAAVSPVPVLPNRDDAVDRLREEELPLRPVRKRGARRVALDIRERRAPVLLDVLADRTLDRADIVGADEQLRSFVLHRPKSTNRGRRRVCSPASCRSAECPVLCHAVSLLGELEIDDQLSKVEACVRGPLAIPALRPERHPTAGIEAHL